MDLSTLIKPQDPSLLAGIQGNILKAHGRHHTANVFIRCNDGMQLETKVWLKSLVAGEKAIIQSGYDQLQSNADWKNALKNNNKNKNVDTGLFACIHISATSYDYLFGEGTRLRFGDGSFQNGMKNADLNDPPVNEWEEGHQNDNHFMLLLAHADPERLRQSVVKAVYDIEFFAEVTAIEKGEALFNKAGAGIEHFGYVDGVSQPLFFESE